jgi:hypothetical protein
LRLVRVGKGKGPDGHGSMDPKSYPLSLELHFPDILTAFMNLLQHFLMKQAKFKYLDTSQTEFLEKFGFKKGDCANPLSICLQTKKIGQICVRASYFQVCLSGNGGIIKKELFML